MVTVVGAIFTFVASLAISDTVTPPAGAGDGRVTDKFSDCPRPTDVFAGRMIEPRFATVIVALAPVTFGEVVEAVMVAVPGFPAVTVIVSDVAAAGKKTLDGTDAIRESLDVRFTVIPPGDGAGTDRFSVRLFLAPSPRVSVFGVNDSPAATVTGSVSPRKLAADAVIFAVPKLTPVICGWVSGVVARAGMNTVAGAILTILLLLLVSAMVAPPTGAGVSKLTGYATDWFGATLALAGSLI